VSPTDLTGLTQNWDKLLPAASRFVVLSAFGGAAVRDNETRLVWEQAPSTTPLPWAGATIACSNKNVGGRKGWRLPAIAELASLIDPSVSVPGPTLPPGHPFTAQSQFYVSASTNGEIATNVWGVDFGDGSVSPFIQKTSSLLLWCVRGPMQGSVY